LFNQHELYQPALQPFASATKANSGGAYESIFIVKSLLSAIIKDYLSDPDEAGLTLSKLRQEIAVLLADEKISYSYFSYIDAQFYLMLSMLKGFHRLTMLILNEKRHIDMAIGDAIRTQENYQKLFRLYANILDAILANNHNQASSSVSELAKLLSSLTLKV